MAGNNGFNWLNREDRSSEPIDRFPKRPYVGREVNVIYTVYRGIAFEEAISVVHKQKYEEDERRNFNNGVAAKAVFGSGIYLVSDLEMASQYAFCHAEARHDFAAVLVQQLTYEYPLILDDNYGEGALRTDALAWKYPDGNYPPFALSEDPLKIISWTGEVIKAFVLHLGYDGIVYYVHKDLVYFVSYFPEQQIRDVHIDFVFNIEHLKEASIYELRKRYKEQNKFS